jgi:hypothetical protein
VKSKQGRVFILLASLTLTIGSVFAATTSISIPNVEFGSGSAETPDCIANAIVDYTTSSAGRLSELTISGIGGECAGRWVRLSLYTSSDGTGQPVEQVVWQMPQPATPPVASYTARADGTQTGIVSGVVWPTSEADTSGILSGDASVVVSTINSFRLETSDSELSDGF